MVHHNSDPSLVGRCNNLAFTCHLIVLRLFSSAFSDSAGVACCCRLVAHTPRGEGDCGPCQAVVVEDAIKYAFYDRIGKTNLHLVHSRGV